jgi:hypothetical protein
VRKLISDDFARAFREVDLVAGPTSPSPAFGIGQKSSNPIEMYLNDIYTIGANLAGLPAMSLPCGFVRGLPVGLQLIAPPLAEGPAAQRPRITISASRTGTAACPRHTPEAAAMSWEIVIGLEIHAQLATASKIFSGASTRYGAAPNAQAALLDLGYPGTLPVLNAEAVRMAIKFGLATGCTISRRSVFARKNYFYPDLPKGYQISQYELPIVHAAASTIELEDGSTKAGPITSRASRGGRRQVAARGLRRHVGHRLESRRHGPARDRVEPDLRSAAEPAPYMRKITRSCATSRSATATCRKARSVATRTCRCAARRDEARYSHGAQEPELVPFRRESHRDRGRAADRAHRERRQGRAGDAALRPDRDETRPMRSKEEANDYRYFPDPDLVACIDRRAAHRTSPRIAARAARREARAIHSRLPRCPHTTRAC